MRWIRCLIATLLCLPTIVRADEAFENITKMIAAGRALEARQMLASALDSYVTAHDETKEAVTLVLLGLTDASLHNVEAARNELQDASTKFIAHRDYMGAWFSLFALSTVEYNEGRTDRALEIHKQVIQLLDEAERPEASFKLDSLAMLAPAFGAEPSSLSMMTSAPEIVKPLMLRFLIIASSDAYGAALIEHGDLDAAEEQLTRAADAALMFGGLFDGTVYTHLGALRQSQWRLQEAKECYLKALKGAKTMGAIFTPTIAGRFDPFFEVDVMNDLATLEVLTGHLDEALAWNDKALQATRAMSNPKRETALLEKRADLLSNGGQYDAALTLYQEVLELATKSDDLYRQGSVRGSLGAVCMYLGNYGSATKHFEKSIEIYQKLKEPFLEAPSWIALAETYLALEDHGNVQNALDNARKMAAQSGFGAAAALVDVIAASKDVHEGRGTLEDVDTTMRAMLNRPDLKSYALSQGMRDFLANMSTIGSRGGEIKVPEQMRSLFAPMAAAFQGKAALQRGEYAKARKLFEDGFATSSSHDHRAGLQALVGTAYWLEGKPDDAIAALRKAADELEQSAFDVKVEELLAGYLGSNRRVYYDLLLEMLSRQGKGDDAFAQAERARARAFLQLIGNHRLNPSRSADPQLVAEAENVRAGIVDRENAIAAARPEALKRLNEDLSRARQHYRSLTIRAKATSSEYADVINVAPVEIQTIRLDLPEDTTLISYYVSPTAVHAWVVDRESANYARLQIDTTSLRRIACWANSFGANESRGASAIPCGESNGNPADFAYDALIAPLYKHIRHQKLVIVPHGVLHYVPFAAMHNSSSNHYLVQDFTLTYAPSASALRFLRAKETPVRGTALVLGDPTTPISGLKPLSGARQEAAFVANLLGTSAYVGNDARENKLYSVGGNVDLVHIAAHGIYDPVNPLFSRIALAPGDKTDGSLTVHEILSSVDLSGVNLVVLSACRSAVGERSGGDEIVGLTRALLYAGTPGVISTLWNIDDAASAGLMNEFYRRLTNGVSVAEALRAAQVSVLESKDFSDPKYWAAFTLNGDPQGRWHRADATGNNESE